jgi:hypothetical protein
METTKKDGCEASQLRTVLIQTLAGNSPARGKILAALRRSPLVGAEIELARAQSEESRATIWENEDVFELHRDSDA